MPTIPRTRTQRVLLLLLLASACIVAASAALGSLMRAHVDGQQRRATGHGTMMVDPALPPGHPPVQGLPPGHPPIPEPTAPPVSEGIRI